MSDEQLQKELNAIRRRMDSTAMDIVRFAKSLPAVLKEYGLCAVAEDLEKLLFVYDSEIEAALKLIRDNFPR